MKQGQGDTGVTCRSDTLRRNTRKFACIWSHFCPSRVSRNQPDNKDRFKESRIVDHPDATSVDMVARNWLNKINVKGNYMVC